MPAAKTHLARLVPIGFVTGVLLLFLGVFAFRRAAAPPTLADLERRVREKPRDVSLRIELAREAHQEGRPFFAAQQLEVALALGDADPRTRMTLARLYAEMGDPGEAIRVLTGADSAEARLERSRLLLQVGRFREAAEALPEGADDASRRRLARVRLLAGDLRGAAAVMPADTTDAEWLALRGWAHYLGHETAAAVRDLQASTKTAPGDAWNRYLLGHAYLASGARSRAMYTWLEAAGLPDAPARAAVNAARLQADDQLWKAADATLARVEKESAADPEFWAVRARVSRQLFGPLQAALDDGRGRYERGDPWAAERLYRETIQRFGSAAELREAWAALVRSAESRSDSRTALDAVTRAQSRWPDDPFFLRRRAELLLEQNVYSEAGRMAERLGAVRGPESEEVLDLKCRVALESADAARFQAASEAYEKAFPADPAPLLLRGEWLQERGRSEANTSAALAAYREAVRRAPQDAEAHARLGGLLAELRRGDEAVPELLRALGLSPRALDGTPDIQLARLYRLEGRKEEAELHERRYAELRRGKDAWLRLLPVLRDEGAPAARWRELGQAALSGGEPWVALCAFVQLTRREPGEAAAWEGLAAAQRRLGRFDEALAAMLRARSVPGGRP